MNLLSIVTMNNKGGLVSCSGKWGKTQARRRSVDFSICYLFSSWFLFLSFANCFQVDFSLCYSFPWSNRKDTRESLVHYSYCQEVAMICIRICRCWRGLWWVKTTLPNKKNLISSFALMEMIWNWQQHCAWQKSQHVSHYVGSQAPLISIKVPDWLSEWQCHMKRAKN